LAAVLLTHATWITAGSCATGQGRLPRTDPGHRRDRGPGPHRPARLRHIQEEDAAFKRKRHQKEGRQGPHPEIPLYTVAEAEAVFPLFRPAPTETDIAVAPGLEARFTMPATFSARP